MTPCPWCGLTDCPSLFDHERDDRASESTWRRAAAVLTPDHPDLSLPAPVEATP